MLVHEMSHADNNKIGGFVTVVSATDCMKLFYVEKTARVLVRRLLDMRFHVLTLTKIYSVELANRSSIVEALLSYACTRYSTVLL